MKKSVLAATAAALLVFVPQSASADPILLDQWYTFVFGGTGSSFASGTGGTLGVNPASISAPDPSWTFTLAQAGSLTVIDGFSSGDQFQITNFGSAIGITSAASTGSDCSNDISACLNNAAMSQGTFNLAAGDYSISGTALTSPFGGGAAFFRVSSVAGVPEPGTWAMMLLGFGAMGFSLRRNRKQDVGQRLQSA